MLRTTGGFHDLALGCFAPGVSLFFEVTELCAGCAMCTKRCPTGAISGERRSQHHIDPSLCKECGACWRQCPKAAIISPAGHMREGRPCKELPHVAIDGSACAGCRNCLLTCPFSAITLTKGAARGLLSKGRCVVSAGCWGCETCVTVCPTGAARLVLDPAVGAKGRSE
jgi:ferredoxin